MRDIDDILAARKDLSPFLVHLTKDTESSSAKNNLESILDSGTVQSSKLSKYSSFHFVSQYPRIDDQVLDKLNAVSFSETPIEEVHCLVDINSRSVNLSQYGVMLLKANIANSNEINPVFYVNTHNSQSKDAYIEFIQAMYDASLDANADYSALMKFMVLFESFGQKLRGSGDSDFYWEREWRSIHDVSFDLSNDLFVGLCPHSEIDYFEKRYQGSLFIDPKVNPRYYAKKLLERKRALGITSNLL